MCPLNVANGQDFKSLMRYVEPNYKVPSCTHITSICCKKYKKIKEELTLMLSTVPNVTLTTDIKTSLPWRSKRQQKVHNFNQCTIKFSFNTYKHQFLVKHNYAMTISFLLQLINISCLY